MNIYRYLFILLTIPVFSSVVAQQQVSLADRVNPFIGTGGHGHTYPGASMPFGMVQLSPDTRLDGWDGCSGYHSSDSVIYGFSHTHLSGTGCSDYGDVLLMPSSRAVNLSDYHYSSAFQSSSEAAKAGYYKVFLSENNVGVELTATKRTGFHRYTFHGDTDAQVVLDLVHRDKVLESGLKIVSGNEVEGFRISRAWAEKQMVYFVARFSKPFKNYKVESGKETSLSLSEFTSDSIRALFTFPCSEGEQILVKVGISGVSTEGARMNMDTELTGWDFDRAVQEAENAWDQELSKILISGGTDDQFSIFYSALYHAMLNPNLYMDVDGRYRGRDLEIHKASGFSYYTVFSLWDTYRAAHPLLAIIDQKRTADFIHTFIRQYEDGGMLPVWELSGNETECMIGYHSVPVIADAWIKGIRDFPAAKAIEAMKHSAEQDHHGLRHYKTFGYIPSDMEGESVSKTLEYAYDDWCMAQMADSLNLQDDYRTYLIRAQYYKNLFDRSTGFMRAKHNATWTSPFDPYEVNFNYTEANAWQYSFYVPQDISGLISLMGGKKKFSERLDALFAAKTETTGRDQADISGLIGQYAHGNEPSHHMAYLYNYAGEPWKTQELVNDICNRFYSGNRDGLIGNEDCGQMSAWYIFSALGFYPVTPGSEVYVIGKPMFPKAEIQLENGKSFRILAEKLSEKNIYIQSITLNGMEHPKSYLTHKDIMNGGALIFTMGSKPNKSFGTADGTCPVSAITEHLITPVPAFSQGEATFMDSTVISLSSPEPQAIIYFTIDGEDPSMQSEVYRQPFVINESSVIKAFAYLPGLPESSRIAAAFKRIPKNRKISITYPYAPQYTAGGDVALINFIRGGDNFRTGNWQGYEGVDLEAVVDLGEIQSVKRLSAGFLQDVDSWIFFPEEITFYTSKDGQDFILAGSSVPEISNRDTEVRVYDFGIEMEPAEVRYVKVIAKSPGTCPSWHPGAGKKAWIFTDEIVIE